MAIQSFPRLSNIDEKIIKELDSRKSRSFGSSNKPKSIWVRAISNGIPPTGFDSSKNVMVGGLLTKSGKIASGFEPVYRRPGRKIQDRPIPGIENISVESKGEYGSLRKVTINWFCPSAEDLDELMKYWLSPGISVIVEWGWADIAETPIQTSVENTGKLHDYYFSPRKIYDDIILASNGNQDFYIGLITNFSWNQNDDGSFSCMTELTTLGETMLALNIQIESNVMGTDEAQKNKKTVTIKEYLDTTFSEEGLRSQIKRCTGKDGNPEPGSIFIANEVVSSYSFSSLPGVVYPSTSLSKPLIFVTWEFLEKVIINGHLGALATNGKKEEPTFKMDSGETLICNDPLLYTTDDNIMFLYKEDSANRKSFEKQAPNTKSGYLKYVYVNIDLIKKELSESETLEEGLNRILKKISSAAADIWNFKLYVDPYVGYTSYVIDLNYVSGDNINSIYSKDRPFVFGGYSGRSIVSDLSFTSKMTNQIALTQYFGRNKADPNQVLGAYSDVIVKLLYGDVKDRILKDLKLPEETKEQAEERKKAEEAKAKEEADYKVKYDDFILSIPPNSNKLKKPGGYIVLSEECKKTLSEYLRRDKRGNETRHMPIYPLEIEVTIDGISGILPGNVFTVENIPQIYKEWGVFQATGISHEISSDVWTTKIRAFYRPTKYVSNEGASGTAG